jgi:hypothetical protein
MITIIVDEREGQNIPPSTKDITVVVRSTVRDGKTLFPEKVKRANEILSKAKLLPR